MNEQKKSYDPEEKPKNPMGRTIAILLAACLLLGGLSVYLGSVYGKKEEEPVVSAVTAQPEAPAAEQSAQEESAGAVTAPPALDLNALYATHDKNEVVARLNGKDVTWGEYFYWVSAMASQVQSYFDTMAMYGMPVSWTDAWGSETDPEQTFAEYALEMAEDYVKQINVIETYAESVGAAVTAEDEKALEEQYRADIAATCGEDATEAAFEKYLESLFMDQALYDRINRMNALYQNGYTTLYGENGEKVSDEDAIAFLQDNGYVSAGHILLLTMDMSTGEALDADTVAAKEAQAKEIADELRAISDPEALLARFAELKELYCEDTGKVSYPDGYTYTPGTMVAEFESTVSALAEYEVSEPVLTSYGYHIILRLPLDADKPVEFTNNGTAVTARALCANDRYGNALQELHDSSELEFLIDLPDINRFVK